MDESGPTRDQAKDHERELICAGNMVRIYDLPQAAKRPQAAEPKP